MLPVRARAPHWRVCRKITPFITICSMGKNWIDDLPTVEECDRKLRELDRLIDDNLCDPYGDPRLTVRLTDLRHKWHVRRVWAKRFGKTDLPW